MKVSESIVKISNDSLFTKRKDYFYDLVMNEIVLCAQYGRRHHKHLLPLMDSDEEQELIERLRSDGFTVNQMNRFCESVIPFLEISW